MPANAIDRRFAVEDAQRREMWAGRIERCLSADMTIKQWCGLNKVSESGLYRWMARFREEEPGRFPRRSSKASNWIKVTAAGIADAKAIVPAGDAAPAGPAPTSGAEAERVGGEARAAAVLPIRALVGRVELAIPAGSAESDIAAAMRAAASL